MMYLSIRHPAYLCEVYRVYASWYVTIYATLSTLLALIYDSATTTTGSWGTLVVGEGGKEEQHLTLSGARKTN